MHYILDTADVNFIKKAIDLYSIEGVTTNLGSTFTPTAVAIMSQQAISCIACSIHYSFFHVITSLLSTVVHIAKLMAFQLFEDLYIHKVLALDFQYHLKPNSFEDTV